jgi:hypothetical protein
VAFKLQSEELFQLGSPGDHGRRCNLHHLVHLKLRFPLNSLVIKINETIFILLNLLVLLSLPKISFLSVQLILVAK